jgi:hypothetical protein
MSEGLHPHAPKKIVREISLYSQEWMTVKREAARLTQQGDEAFRQQGPLIRYLERALIAMPMVSEHFEMRSLLMEYDALKALHAKLERFYTEEVEPFIINFRVGELISLRETCAEFARDFSKYEYLAQINDGKLWDFYYPAIESAGNDAFVGFSQDNKDTYSRLKIRSLEERLFKMQSGASSYVSTCSP